MKQYAILVLLLAFTAVVFATEIPSKSSKVVFTKIERSGGKFVEANIAGLVDECFYGRNISCTEGGYEVFPCDGSTEETSDTEVKREVVPCGEDCECGVSIPSDGFITLTFEGEDCAGTPEFFSFGLLDICIDAYDMFYKYIVDNTTYKALSYETEMCEGAPSSTLLELPLRECTDGKFVELTNDLEGPVDEPDKVDEPDNAEGSVAMWVASVAFIVLSVVVSA